MEFISKNRFHFAMKNKETIANVVLILQNANKFWQNFKKLKKKFGNLE